MLKIMKTSKNRILPVVLLVQVLLFIGCINPDSSNSEGCDPIKDEYCNVRTNEFVKIPYRVHDTILLQKNNDSTIYYFVQQSIDSSYGLYQDMSFRCPGDRQHMQAIDFQYQCSLYAYPLIVSVYHTRDCNSSDMCVIFDKNLSFNSYPGRLRPPYHMTNLNIKGKVYDRVIKFDLYFPDSTQYVLFDSLYGVVQIKSKGNTWYRYPK